MEDYKQKYEEALERARNYHEGHTLDVNPRTAMEYIFPELKKSDDDRIRKELIHFFKNHMDSVYEEISDNNVVIDWLEKQGVITKLSEEERNGLGKGVLTSCAMSFIDYLDAHRYEGKMCVSNGECEDIENAFHNAMWDKLHRYYCKYIEKTDEKANPYSGTSFEYNGHHWGMCARDNGVDILLDKQLFKHLDEQGEQKPTNKINPRFKVGDTIRPKGSMAEYTIESIYGECYHGKGWGLSISCDEDYELVEQKPTDKVEPKFKVGDWIVQENIGVYKIIEICESWYEVIDFEDNHYSISFDNECMCHLWSIQDAKPGDVLTTKNFIFIFKNIDNDNGVRYYCHYEISNYEADDLFEVAFPQFVMGRVGNGISYYSPATKEQRDLLFQKMKESGYEWDAENKELKKIEKKTTWSEKIKGLNELETYILSLVPDRPLDAIKVDAKNIRYIINKEKPHDWGEDDERMIDTIIYDLERNGGKEDSCYSAEIVWLKSLKERVQPKQTNAWSEEDERMINDIIEVIDEDYVIDYQEIVTWLKSLKEKYERIVTV